MINDQKHLFIKTSIIIGGEKNKNEKKFPISNYSKVESIMLFKDTVALVLHDSVGTRGAVGKG